MAKRVFRKLFPAKEEEDDMAWSPKTLPDDDPWIVFARAFFTDDQPPWFARKDLRKPLLDLTPEDEAKDALAIWKIILRFMGDQADLRGDIEPGKSHQPDQGSVMSRLYTKLGVSQSERDLRRSANQLKQQNGTSDTSEDVTKIVGKTKRGGTLRRLKATLTRRLFEQKTPSAFDMLPLEETLMTPLDQMHFIVGYGILKPCLRDEIFCQICKQLVKNPFKASQARGWLMLTLCAGCFSPSEKVLDVIRSFILHGPQYYSSTCKMLLRRTQENGPRFQPPSLEELDAGLQKKLLEIQVTFMDGTQQSVSVDAATTARELCLRLARGLGLRETFGFSVYITMYDKVASLGNGNDHLFDAISQCEQIFREKEGRQGVAPWRLFYRKEIFSPWDHFSNDAIATNLVYAQVVRGVMLGEYQVEKDVDLAVLSAQQYYIDYGPYLTNEGLNAVLPSYIPPERRDEIDSLRQWKKIVVKAFRKLFTGKDSDPTVDSVKADVVRYAKTKWAIHFSRYYDVKKLEGPMDWPNDVITLAVNWMGISLMRNGNVIYKMLYPEIAELHEPKRDSPNEITITKVNGAVFKFFSSDSDDIRHIVTFMMEGLRQRSRYAIALQSAVGKDSSELSYLEGDLIEMVRLDPKVEVSEVDTRTGKNLRTGESGSFSADHIHIIPTVSKPSPEIMKIFGPIPTDGPR